MPTRPPTRLGLRGSSKARKQPEICHWRTLKRLPPVTGADEGVVGFEGGHHVQREPRVAASAARSLEQRPPDRPEMCIEVKDVWTIRVRLQLEERKRDLALFNLTIEPREEIHDGTPVILGPEACPVWRGERAANPPRLTALLAPYPSEGMTRWPVSAHVGNARNNHARLIGQLVRGRRRCRIATFRPHAGGSLPSVGRVKRVAATAPAADNLTHNPAGG